MWLEKILCPVALPIGKGRAAPSSERVGEGSAIVPGQRWSRSPSARQFTVLTGLMIWLAGLGVPSASMAQTSTISTFRMGMVYSGTPAFDATAGAGKDTSATDAVVRTFDAVAYRVDYALSASDTGKKLVLQIGAGTLPGNYVGPANPRMAYFAVSDIPVGSGGCQNIQATALTAADLSAGTKSGVSADGQTLVCVQPVVTTATQDFIYRVAGTAPNGGTIAPPIATLSTTSGSSSSTPTSVSGALGAGTVYGLSALTVSAAPRWNLAVNDGSGWVASATGPNGEDGVVFRWWLGIYAMGSRKGLEALANPYTINYNFNNPNFPNARLMNWNVTASGSSANLSPSGQNGCGDMWYQIYMGGVTVDRSDPHDLGVVDNSSDYGTVARGGTCDAVVIDNSTKTATLSLNDTDFSLNFYPSYVDPLNLDAAGNRWWAAYKSVAVWAPLTDLPYGTTKNNSSSGSLSATSVTGQANIEPTLSDNSSGKGVSNSPSFGFRIDFVTPASYSNPNGLSYAIADANNPGYSNVTNIAPGEVVKAEINADYGRGGGYASLSSGLICHRVDNARFTLLDITSPAYAIADKDPKTGVIAWVANTPFVLTWQLGVGGTGTAGGTWTSLNTVSNPYTATPATSGSAQSDSRCDDADATWYNSVSDLLAAGHSLKEVSRVRGSYPSWPAGSVLTAGFLLQANASYSYSGMDNPPGTAFTAGASTLGAVAPTQAEWYPGTGIGNRKASDAVRIAIIEFASITKSSTSHPVNGQTVPAGDIVTYKLQVNLTGNTSHVTDVEVWDVLPSGMGYNPGSSTLGGAPIADPVCAASGLPTALFPSGSVPAGYSACRWTLSNQNVFYGKVAAAGGNLPALTYKAGVQLGLANATSLLTTATATSTANTYTLAPYASASAGFVCPTGKVCSVSNWTLVTNTSSGLRVSKAADKAVVQPGDLISHTLNYTSVGAGVSGNPRIIDVLPYAGDGRSPASSFSGSLRLASYLVAPVADATVTPNTSADPGIQYYYTKNTPANINRDGGAPYVSGASTGNAHDLTGASANSASLTNWCTQTQITTGGNANCPTGLSDITAVLAVPFQNAASNPGALPADQAFTIKLPMQPVGNAVPSLYANSFSLADPTRSAAVASNTVSTKVVAPDLIISHTVSPSVAAPGDTVTYAILVTNDASNANAGPYNSGTITVSASLPGSLSAVLPITATGWDCSASTASQISCTYSGSLPVPSGAGVGSLIKVPARLASTGALAGATLSTTASVSSSSAAISTSNNSATASITVTPLLSLSKTSSTSGNLSPGATVNYTVTASNVGILAADGASLADPLPSGMASANWSCTASGGASISPASGSGALSATLTSLPAGASVSCAITATAAASGLPVSITNTASLNSSLSGAQCLNGTARASVPCVASVTHASAPIISLVQSSDGNNALVAGAVVNYTFTATNSSAASAAGTVIADALPAGIASWSWSCAATGGAVCPAASGSAALNQTVATWPAGAAITYSIRAVVADPVSVSSITNTVTASPPGGSNGLCSPANCQVSVGDTVLGATIAVAKSVNKAVALSGDSLAYTLTVSNTSANGAPATGTQVADSLPAGANWVCAASGGAACPAASGSGSINHTLTQLPAGSQLVYTLGVNLPASGSGLVTNTATATPAAGAVCASTPCQASASTWVSDIILAPESASVPAGTAATAIANVRANDIVNGAAATGANSILSASGSWPAGITLDTNSGAINVAATVLPGSYSVAYTLCDLNAASACKTVSDTITVTAAINPVADTASVPAGTAATAIANVRANDSVNGVAATGANSTVAVSGTWPAGITLDTSTGAINVADTVAIAVYKLSYTLCDKNTPANCASVENTITVSGEPVVSVSMTVTPATGMKVGDTLRYEITVRSIGNMDADGTTVHNLLPTGLSQASWTCSASGGATCPAAAGSGAISHTVARLPVRSQLVYVMRAVLSAPGSVVNRLSATPPDGQGGQGAVATGSATVSTAEGIATVPTLGTWALIFLSVLLLTATGMYRRFRA
ncbi:MAG: IPTL-CTERM sorting domain-containing protein [Curvibacter sp.]|nr:MAG: IPTL-CTERM sorting domain-containing protein [Curvibacter sp.]